MAIVEFPMANFEPQQDFSFITDYGDHIISGFGMTMYLYISALIIGFFLGLFLALVRQYGGGFTSRLATGYIELIRSTPLLVQLFLLFMVPFTISNMFEAAGFGVTYSNWTIYIGDTIVLNHTIFMVILALGLNSAAYQAEYFRGAIGSIGAGQIMASQSIGMSQQDGIRHIILPQSLRRVIPAWSNEAAYLPKYTVVAYYLGVEELFAKAHFIVTQTFQALPVYIIIAIIFLSFISISTKGLDIMYNRMKIPGV